MAAGFLTKGITEKSDASTIQVILIDLFLSLPACQKYPKFCYVNKFEENIECP